eukprot:CAMPEP_0205809744 /NCGR_PEP_ID=MMETSP0205-20121125/13981_1 /ASSEMBLY_ACC=CAM_ASM_000278 /TAXON_ID=36767 /ORGANISM="Euplotes focardii, Strain TN1" /LENGTH=42 /DNA_ID= /DNA_START= /DNA_END= /DNA_ORIENTATION=
MIKGIETEVRVSLEMSKDEDEDELFEILAFLFLMKKKDTKKI